MPNTLVHLGVQSVSTKALFRQADFKWIAVGCIIPDIPWIIKRAIILLGIDVNVYELALYTSVQASLLFSLVLCGSIALLCASPFRMYLLLATNVFFHLFLDAMQIKWANGVHFFAPFSWQMTRFDLLWPENGIIYFLTTAGIGVLLYFGLKDWKQKVVLCVKPAQYMIAILFLSAYLILPFWLRFGPEQANYLYIDTLRKVEGRIGEYVEFDRGHYNRSDNTVEIFSGERIKVTGDQPLQDNWLSIKGRFVNPNTIHITEFHLHNPMRDMSSIIGLAGILLIWVMALLNKRIVYKSNNQIE